MSCPDENSLSEFVHGLLDGDLRRSVTAHIDACEACRRTVACVLAAATSAGLESTQQGASVPAPSPSVDVPLAQGDSVGRYVILNVLGQGGMGVVYRAYDPQLNRRVALKLIRAEAASVEGYRARLLREAQAMARLSHPNVVTVHDAATLGDRLFIAMELVEGSTLREWARSQPRTWRQVVGVFLAAGRGLAAAHAAGLVHRDFKPENVLVGEDGAVRVTDFGLAALEDAPPESDTASSTSSGPELSPDRNELTRTGVLLGTPAYMAPEQLRRRRVDARSDQFSFCVSLYETLYGERPFEGATLEELRENVERGRLRPEPARAEALPAWLKRALLKGLAKKPSERHASMDALLALLQRSRGPWVRLGAPAAVGALAALAFTFAARGLDPKAAAACRQGATRLADLWSEPRKEALRKSFEASGLSFSSSAYRVFRASLDGYAAEWNRTYLEACEATRVRGEQPEEVLSHRMGCLERRRRYVSTLLQVYEKPDASLIRNAGHAALSLPSVDPCATTSPDVADRIPLDRSRQQGVEVARDLLQRARALAAAGGSEQALAAAEAAVAQARSAGYPPVVAETLLLRGKTEERMGRYSAAEATAYEAATIAQSAGDDELVAQAFTELQYVVGYRGSRFQEAERWAGLAEAAILRMGGHAVREAGLRMNQGSILQLQGKYADARRLFERALALREASLPKEHPVLAPFLLNLSTSLRLTGEYARAGELLDRALAMQQSVYGDQHPELVYTLNNRAVLERSQGRAEQSLATYAQALAMAKLVHDPEHPAVADLLHNRANSYFMLGRFEEAKEDFAAGLAIREKRLAPNHVAIGRSHEGLGMSETALGHFDQARRHFEELRRISGTLGAPEKLAHAELCLVELSMEAGKPKEALAQLEGAAPLLRKTLEQDPSLHQRGRGLEGRALLALGRWKEAREPLEEALDAAGARRPEPDELAPVRFALARVLWEEQQRERAREEAKKAVEEFSFAKEEHAKALGEARRWLASHGGPSADSATAELPR